MLSALTWERQFKDPDRTLHNKTTAESSACFTLTPVLFLLVSSREMVKEAARLGELSTSLSASRHSPRNLDRFKRWCVSTDTDLGKRNPAGFKQDT